MSYDVYSLPTALVSSKQVEIIRSLIDFSRPKGFNQHLPKAAKGIVAEFLMPIICNTYNGWNANGKRY